METLWPITPELKVIEQEKLEKVTSPETFKT
jgi:hypothetical protein